MRESGVYQWASPILPRRHVGTRCFGERQVKAYPRTQTDRRTVVKANEAREPEFARFWDGAGAELSALFVRRCLVAPSGLCRPVWISRMTKPAEDRVAGEFNPAGRLTGPCDNFSIDVNP